MDPQPSGASAERIITPEEINAKADKILEDCVRLAGATGDFVREEPFENLKGVLAAKLVELGAWESMHSSIRENYSGYVADNFVQLASALRVKANQKLAEIVPPIVERIRADTEERIKNLTAEI